jgi:hypothetical protein
MPSMNIKVSGKKKEIKKAIFELLLMVHEGKVKIKVETDTKQFKKMYGN